MWGRAGGRPARLPSTMGVLVPPVVGGPAMVPDAPLLVTLCAVVDRIPLPPVGPPRRGRPATYSDRLILKALVIMVLKRLPTVHALLAVPEQPSPEVRRLRAELTARGRRRAAHVDRHRGALDQVRLARLGLRLEAAPGGYRRRRLAPAARGAHPGQRRRQRRGVPLGRRPADR